MPNRWMKVLTLLSFATLLFLLFKNIKYPLFWNDEADTAAFAQRIIEYGYPKVHGVKNVISHSIPKHPEIGLKKSIDANVVSGWGQYYFAVPFVWLSSFFDDLYTKTEIIRIPYALFGLVGLLAFSFAITPIFKNDDKKKFTFLTLYFLIEASSAYILLHLREVRSHPLSLFLTGILFFIYIRYNFFGQFSRRRYFLLMVFLLLVLFNVLYLTYFSFVIAILLYALIDILKDFLKNKKLTRELVFKFFNYINIQVVLVSLLTILPFIFFYEIPLTSSSIRALYKTPLIWYLEATVSIFIYFSITEYLLAAVIIRFVFSFGINNNSSRESVFRKIVGVSNFSFLLIFITILIVINTPILFTRYLITIQPLSTLGFLVCSLVAFGSYKKYEPFSVRTTVLLALFCLVFFRVLMVRVLIMSRYVHEITTRYMGVLDVVIPYIKENHTNPKELTIATNYEEEAIIFYLGSKTIVGYTGNNLADDVKLSPDIIIPRPSREENLDELKGLLKKGRYKKATFPIMDYQVNNIPELYYKPAHLFSTLYAKDDNDRLVIYEKD
ncbi:MAG: hypothetical protein UT61_C0031G0010 [Candidatus Woesebacteria bacterium GW2011_GWA1_39_8]|uniref:Glycosyltransferase RgtA/B/C/D-like domain-containing protein n=1 Tax=Candidatus Woesebacteria bacterium GW2011_GWA1_39_8 TaxID=1618552 RepID=A0A0G0SUX9_9BACT|nr:MAG: hypothetical protein UT61_C0031G0010 [Candidatus Woesebacteria bacterium GW2011_GWA1_39_8]